MRAVSCCLTGPSVRRTGETIVLRGRPPTTLPCTDLQTVLTQATRAGMFCGRLHHDPRPAPGTVGDLLAWALRVQGHALPARLGLLKQKNNIYCFVTFFNVKVVLTFYRVLSSPASQRLQWSPHIPSGRHGRAPQRVVLHRRVHAT